MGVGLLQGLRRQGPGMAMPQAGRIDLRSDVPLRCIPAISIRGPEGIAEASAEQVSLMFFGLARMEVHPSPIPMMRLHLHVGHGKTGSSFLQSWWALNRFSLLDEAQLHYPLASGHARAVASGFSMGNGSALDQAFQRCQTSSAWRRWWQRLQGQVASGMPPLHGVLFSAERWTRHLPNQCSALLEMADACGIEKLNVWLLVRDPLDHALSVYGQMVKRHGFSGGLDAWLATYDFPDALLNFLEVFQSMPEWVDLHVDHYGRGKTELLERMQAWLHLSGEVPWQQPAQSTVNRSLTTDELLLLRWLNTRLGDRAAVVGEQLVDRLPGFAPARLQVTRAMYDQFVVRWKPCLDRINQRLPNTARLQLPLHAPLVDGVSVVDESSIRLSREQLDCLLDGLSTVYSPRPIDQWRAQWRSWVARRMHRSH